MPAHYAFYYASIFDGGLVHTWTYQISFILLLYSYIHMYLEFCNYDDK